MVPGSLPGARVAGWISEVAFIFTFAPMFFLVLLFPDGRLPSRRWRLVLWVMVAVTAGWVAQQLQVGTRIDGGFTNALYASGVSYPTPFGVLPRHGWFSGFLAVLLPLALITGVLVVVSVFVRRRGASAERRKQLAWLGYVGVLVAVPVVAFLPYGFAVNGNVNPVAGAIFWAFLLVIPTVGVPLACAVAVLKYRLYEIDRIISRTLAYAIVTGLLIGVYTDWCCWPRSCSGSTLQWRWPRPRWPQRHCSPRWGPGCNAGWTAGYRARYDADQTIGAFAACLKDVMGVDSLRSVTSRVHQISGYRPRSELVFRGKKRRAWDSNPR